MLNVRDVAVDSLPTLGYLNHKVFQTHSWALRWTNTQKRVNELTWWRWVIKTRSVQWIINRTEKEKSQNEQKMDVFSLDLKMLTELTSWMCSGWLFQRIGALWATTLPPEEFSLNQGTVKYPTWRDVMEYQGCYWEQAVCRSFKRIKMS